MNAQGAEPKEREAIKRKSEYVETVKTFLQKDFCAFVNFSGLNVQNLTQLRRSLDNQNIHFQVIKNTLVIRAADSLNLDASVKTYLTGPTACASGADASAISKILYDFAKNNEALKIKGGLFLGKVVPSSEINALATLPPREQLLSMLCSTLQSPISGLVYVLSAQINQLLLALKAIQEKKEQTQ